MHLTDSRRTVRNVSSACLDLTRAALLAGLFCVVTACQADKLSPEDALKKDVVGEYMPRPFPPAAEVLNRIWDAKLPGSPLYPKVITPVTEGFASSRLSPLPTPGVHPRVVLVPGDIERIRRFVFLGEDAPMQFRQAFAELKAKADKEGTTIKEYAPWVGPCSGIASKALLALITGNETAGREAAALTVEHAGKMLELLAEWDEQPAAAKDDVRNMYNAAPSHSMSIGLEYDYAHAFMTDEQRTIVRDAIARWTAGRYTSFMEMPDHFLINNHWGFAMNWWVCAMAIEGEPGYDPRVGEVGRDKVYAYVTSSLSPSGMMFEGQKPNLPPYPMMAAGRRKPELFQHPHLHAFTIAALNSIWWNEGDSTSKREQDRTPRWMTGRMGYRGLGDEIRIYPAELMKFFYPNNPQVDLAWTIHGGPWGTAQGHFTGVDLRLLALTGLHDREERYAAAIENGLPENVTRTVPLTWHDPLRGALRTRTGWSKDDIVLWFENKSDYYSAGHEVSEHNNFLFASHGVAWTPYAGRYVAPKGQNMILIDGKASPRWQPVPGTIVGLSDTGAGTAVCGDATDGYNWQKKEKLMEGWHPMLEVYGNDWLKLGGSGIGRDWELPFSPQIRAFNEGFAHLEWGNWHGETRGPERVRQWNEVEHVFRTVQLARGKHPYILVIDDVRKDDAIHKCDWVLNLLRHRVELLKADKDDLLFGIKGSDAQLLLRVLYRNTGEQVLPPTYIQDRVTVSTAAVEPEFRILLYPHRKGDPLPQTVWSADRGKLSVLFSDQADVYSFGKTGFGRTLFALERDGDVVQRTEATPANPVLDGIEDWYGEDCAGLGGHRHSVPDEQRDHVFPFVEGTRVAFRAPQPGGEIRYTTDGSEPTATSAVYGAPILLTQDTTLKARTFQRGWRFGENGASAVMTARFEKRVPAKSVPASSAKLVPGLVCELFEVVRTIYDEQGFFTGKKNMMPDLDDREPRLRVGTAGIQVPQVPTLAPERRQSKGFYRYSGFFRAECAGVYRFRLESPGPVVLRIGGRIVVSHTGQYYHSNRDRFGAVALEAGLHTFEFTFCDKAFFRGRTRSVFKDYGHGGSVPIAVYYEQPLVVSLAAMAPGENVWSPVGAERFLRASASVEAWSEPAPPHLAAALTAGTRPGLRLLKYDLSERIDAIKMPYIFYPRDFLEVAGTTPFSDEPVTALQDNAEPKTRELYEYRGFLYVPVAGIYHFRTDPAGINQLVIGGIEVQDSRLAGEFPNGAVHLETGRHAISLRIWQSDALLEMQTPGTDAFLSVSMVDLTH